MRWSPRDPLPDPLATGKSWCLLLWSSFSPPEEGGVEEEAWYHLQLLWLAVDRKLRNASGQPFNYLSFFKQVEGREVCFEWGDKGLTRIEENYVGLELLLNRVDIKSKQSQGTSVYPNWGESFSNIIIANQLDCEIVHINI